MKNLPIIDITDCYNKSDVARKLKLSINGKSMQIVERYILKYNLSILHFDLQNSNRKYKLTQKICPICNNIFTVKNGSPKEKTTCSLSCSNTYFRSGLNNKFQSYRKICFLIHKKECIICKENRVVEVHHLDKNRKNNDPMNLIPLCPTHHSLIHSKYKHEIIDSINEYLQTNLFDNSIINIIRQSL